MKPFIQLLTLMFVLFIAGCGNEVKSDINDYKTQMKDVQTEEKKLVHLIDELQLDKADQLIGSEVTEKKKEKLSKTQEDIEKKVLPQLDRYEKKLDQVEIKTKEVQDVHKEYTDNFKKKKAFINDLHDYIKLYNDSIASNEQILGYTKVFEKNQALVERYADRAVKRKAELPDYTQLTSVINKNSDQLKNKVEYLMSGATTEQKEKYIDEILTPLLKSYVQNLNKTNIKSPDVIQMRKAQIEIYYSLMNYYKERKNAMKIEEKLQSKPIQNILENAKMIRTLDDKYYDALQKLEEKA